MNITEWRMLPKEQRRVLWQQWDNAQRLEMYNQFKAETPIFKLPYPDDYNDPADSPLVLRELALAVEAALGTIASRVIQKADKSYVDSALAGKADVGHVHTPDQAGFRFGRFGVGSIPGQGSVTKTVAHGLGKTPTIAMGTAYADTGVQSAGVSVERMDSSNVVWKIGNWNNTASEYLDVSWLVA